MNVHGLIRRRLPLLGAVLCALLLATAGCGRPSTEQESIAAARERIAAHDWKAAVVELKAALQQHPQSSEARFLLGRALLETGDVAAAIVELNKARDLGHDDNDTVPVLARAMLQQGRAKEVTQDFGRSRLQDSGAIADLKTTLASAYLQLGSRAQADAELQDAERAVAGLPAAQLVRARLQIADRDSDGALATVQRVLERNPQDKDAWLFKGQLLYYGKADLDAAIDAYRKALAIDDRHLPAYSSLIGALLAKRDVDAFKSEVAAMRKALPGHPQTRFFEAQAAFLDRDLKSAREIVQQLMRVAPNNLRLLQLAAAIELQSGEVFQAQAYLNRVLQSLPGAPVPSRMLARAYLASGRANQALTTLEPLLKDADAEFETLALAAEAHLVRGDAARAEQLFDRASALKPDDPSVRTARALIQLAKGVEGPAFSELQSVAASDSGSTADMALIATHLRRNELDAALAAIAVLEAKQPGQPLAPTLRGNVLLLQGQRDAARRSYEQALAIDPSHVAAAAGLARIGLLEGKFDEARAPLDEVLRRNPRDVQALLELSAVRRAAGAPPKEIADLLGRAVQAGPTDAVARVALVEHYLRVKDPAAALAAAQEAAAAIPDHPDVLTVLGQARFAAGDPQQAISAYRKLAALEPRSPLPPFRLAEVYVALGDRASALGALERSLQISPRFLPAQRAYVATALTAGQIDAALKMARSVQKDRPQEDIGYLLEGEVELARRRWDAATKSLRAALERGDRSEVAIKLHQALALAGEGQEAERFAAKRIETRPDDLAFASYLADRATAQGRFTEAERLYRRLQAARPKDPALLNNLAFVLLQQGNAEALALAERANELAPNQPRLLDTLALALLSAGKAQRALEVQQKAVAAEPETPALRLTLAKIRLALGQRSEAKVELDELVKLGPAFPGQNEVAGLRKSL